MEKKEDNKMNRFWAGVAIVALIGIMVTDIFANLDGASFFSSSTFSTVSWFGLAIITTFVCAALGVGFEITKNKGFLWCGLAFGLLGAVFTLLSSSSDFDRKASGNSNYHSRIAGKQAERDKLISGQDECKKQPFCKSQANQDRIAKLNGEIDSILSSPAPVDPFKVTVIGPLAPHIVNLIRAFAVPAASFYLGSLIVILLGIEWKAIRKENVEGQKASENPSEKGNLSKGEKAEKGQKAQKAESTERPESSEGKAVGKGGDSSKGAWKQRIHPNDDEMARIKKAVRELHESGQKVTGDAVSKLAKVARQKVSAEVLERAKLVA